MSENTELTDIKENTKLRRFMSIVEERAAQRRKKLYMIMLTNFIWILGVIYYVWFGMPIEIYVWGFLVFIGAIIFLNVWIKIDPIPDWDDI